MFDAAGLQITFREPKTTLFFKAVLLFLLSSHIIINPKQHWRPQGPWALAFGSLDLNVFIFKKQGEVGPGLDELAGVVDPGRSRQRSFFFF